MRPMMPAGLPEARVGELYSVPLEVEVSGGDCPLIPVYEVVEGTLPEGIALSADGVLVGTPSAQGIFTFQVRALFQPNPSEFNYNVVGVGREYSLAVRPR